MKQLSLIALLFSFALAVQGQSASSILKSAEKALGGKKRIAAVNAWERRGRITNPAAGTSGSYTELIPAPGSYYLGYDLNGFEVELGSNGRSGWYRDSRNGLSTLIGDRSLDLFTRARYRNSLWLNRKKERARVTSGGTADLNGRPAHIVDLSTPRGPSIKLWFDAATQLPVREEMPFGDETLVLEYSDFRDVLGTKQPFSITMRTGDETLLVTLDTVTPNARIADGAFDFPQASGEPLPEIPVLLQELQANEDRVEKLLETYSYTQRTARRELGKDGVLRETSSETVQMSFYKGDRIRRLIEKNDKPLSERDQAGEDRDVQKQIEDIEKRIARSERRSASGPPSNEGQRVSIAEVLRASRLINPRRERFRGRDVIVFDFEPNPDFDMKNAKSVLKFFGKTAGVMWIDERDKQVVRVEAHLADSFNIAGGLLAKLRKGATFTMEQERVNDEIWLPAVAEIDLSVRVLLVKGVNINQVVRSFDYRKFEAAVEDSSVGDR